MRGAAAAALLAVSASTLAGCSTGRSGASGPTSSQTRAIVRAQEVVLIGGDDTVGTRCGGTGEANWTSQLEGAFFGAPITWTVAGARGAGYTVKGADDKTFGDLVATSVTPTTTTVVLLQEAEDATDVVRVGDAADATFARIRTLAPNATIISYGPVWAGAGAFPAELAIASDMVRIAADRHNVQYAPTTAWLSDGAGLTCADQSALTDAGQRAVAAHVADSLRVVFAR